MRRVFLARVTSAQLALVPANRTDVIQKGCGAVVGLGCKRRTCSRPRHMERRGDPMSRARSRLVMHTNYDGCTFASVQYCSVLGTYEHTDWRHFRKDRNRCLAECCQRRSHVHQHRQQTPSKDVRFDTQKSRSGSEGTLGEVVDGTTVQSGATIAQFL